MDADVREPSKRPANTAITGSPAAPAAAQRPTASYDELTRMRAGDERIILVNNAGAASSGPAEDETPEHLATLLDTNLTGLFALTQLVGRYMLERASGAVVKIASLSATVSLDRHGLAGYAASKAGVVALTRELAWQWGRRACE